MQYFYLENSGQGSMEGRQWNSVLIYDIWYKPTDTHKYNSRIQGNTKKYHTLLWGRGMRSWYMNGRQEDGARLFLSTIFAFLFFLFFFIFSFIIVIVNILVILIVVIVAIAIIVKNIDTDILENICIHHLFIDIFAGLVSFQQQSVIELLINSFQRQFLDHLAPPGFNVFLPFICILSLNNTFPKRDAICLF